MKPRSSAPARLVAETFCRRLGRRGRAFPEHRERPEERQQEDEQRRRRGQRLGCGGAPSARPARAGRAPRVRLPRVPPSSESLRAAASPGRSGRREAWSPAPPAPRRRSSTSPAGPARPGFSPASRWREGRRIRAHPRGPLDGDVHLPRRRGGRGLAVVVQEADVEVGRHGGEPAEGLGGAHEAEAGGLGLEEVDLDRAWTARPDRAP